MTVLDWLLPLILAGPAVFGATALATRLVAGALRRRAILDHPNARSSHDSPTPRGGGWGVVPVLLLAWGALSMLGAAPPPALLWPLLAAGTGLALVSWWDDLRGLPALPRLTAQALAAVAGLTALPGDGLVFQGLAPAWLDHALVVLAWLWFVNLFNFMDGIDGMAGGELATIGIGLALSLAVSAVLAGAALTVVAPLLWPALALGAAGAAFLVWNWHPARVFLGDVGSVPLGYLAGWLLLAAAVEGVWLPALILPLYYLTDATVTLGRRLLRGARFWEAHREHAYQRAVQAGKSHARVVRAVLTTNAALVACALAAAAGVGAWILVVAGFVVAELMAWLLAPAHPDDP